MSDIGKEKSRIIELNEIAYTKLILSIEVSEKTAFNIIKGCKTKDHQDGNATSPWERLKKNMSRFSSYLSEVGEAV